MPHPDTLLPSLVAHADWSKDPRKRWCATTVRGPDRRYRAESAEPVGDLGTYFDRLRQRAGGGSVLAGFDFPIGLPWRYAAKAGLSDFRSALAGFGHGRWRDFYQPGETKAAIGIVNLLRAARSCPVKSTLPIVFSRRTSPHPIQRTRGCGAGGGEPTAGGVD